MRRTQIQLTDAQARMLRELSASTGRSVADLIRESLDRYLQNRPMMDREALRQRALELIGKYQGGAADVAIHHDDYLDEIYGDR